MTEASSRRLRLLGYQTTGGVIILLFWAALTYTESVSAFILPPPTDVVRALIEGWTDGPLAHHVLTTLRAFGTALLVATVAGVALGVLPGLMPRLHRSVEPLIGLALSIPMVTYFAFLIVFFGYGFFSVLALGIVTALAPMVVSTITAFQGVDKLLIRVGHVYCGSKVSLFRRILLPGALATLASGIRIAAGRALIGVLVGEMFLSSHGLGAQVVRSTGFFDVPAYFAVVLTLAIISYGIALIFSAIENKMTVFDN